MPDSLTCGMVCSQFPACLRPPSPELLVLVAQFSADLERERSSAAAIACALADVYEVITEELGEEAE
jgi:hypothetical protein